MNVGKMDPSTGRRRRSQNWRKRHAAKPSRAKRAEKRAKARGAK